LKQKGDVAKVVLETLEKAMGSNGYNIQVPDPSVQKAMNEINAAQRLQLASVVLAMVIPSLALLPPKARVVTECGLIIHTLLVCYIENRLFTYTSIYYFGFDDDVIYPSYMVITTTVLGLALVRRLALDNRIGPKAVWILTCLYAAKLSMLVLTSKTVLWATVILLLAVSPPLLLYKDKGGVLIDVAGPDLHIPWLALMKTYW